MYIIQGFTEPFVAYTTFVVVAVYTKLSVSLPEVFVVKKKYECCFKINSRFLPGLSEGS